MFKRILTPLDGSQLSEGILPYVRALAPALGARVDLLRMHTEARYELEQLEDTEQASITAALEPLNVRLQHLSEAYLSRIAEGLSGLGVETRILVRYGHPATQIVAEAEKDEDTLIAMSTRGRAGLGRWVMGSVTDRVLHTTLTPLLVVHPERGGPAVDSVAKVGTLIVPLDGSDLAEAVLPIAGGVATATGASVLLTRVLDEPGRSSLNVNELAASGVSEATREEGEAAAYLGEKAENLRKTGAADVHTTVVRGIAAEQIEDLARTTPDSMILACTHGRSGVGRAVMGSVTDRLARHSGHPALVVRARR
ncbi:MAG: universal stress protein [Chloroflexi bacterium]|nr:universal stress protein [Chloroflexota bacterium]